MIILTIKMKTVNSKQKSKQNKKQNKKQWGIDQNAKYNEYQPEKFTKEYYEELVDKNKKNAWTKHMLSKDYAYDPKMMDPKYLAMTGAKRGLKAYFGDVNDDGVADVALVDEKGKIKNFNGFSQKQSKRRQLINYYDQVGPEHIKNGRPVYHNQKEFKDWIQRTAEYELQRGNLRKLNTELGHKGYAGYKLKEKTVSEQIRTSVKPSYQNLIMQIAQANGFNPIIVKRTMPYNLFIAIYIRVVLNSLFGANPESRSDDEQGQMIAKTLKKKWNGTQFEPLKQSVINVFEQLDQNGFYEIGNAIWNGFINGNDNLRTQISVINQFGNNIVASFNDVSSLCIAALQARMQMPTKKIPKSNKPVPMTKRSQRQRFNPLQVQDQIINLD